MVTVSLNDLLQSADRKRAAELVPATFDDLRGLLDGTTAAPLNVGDIVTLRPHARGQFRYPKMGQHVVITQVLKQTLHDSTVSPTHGTAAQPYNIAIAMKTPEPCSDPHCGLASHVVELLHHSRDFVKVGSVFANAAH